MKNLFCIILFIATLFSISCNDKSEYVEFRMSYRKPNGIGYLDRPLTKFERETIIEMFKEEKAEYYVDEDGKVFVKPFINHREDFEATLMGMSEEILILEEEKNM